MASQCKRQQCTIDRRGFRQELDSWRHKLIHCVGFESILEGLFDPELVEDLKLFKDFEPIAVSDWSFDENCLFCCLRRDKVKEHIGLSNEGLEDTTKPLLVKDLTTISRLEKQAEEFLNAVLCRKDVPNFSDPHIPIVAREILQRMIRQFASEYTSKTSSPQDSCPDSQPRSDQSLPSPPLLSGAPPSTSPAATQAGPAHNQNPVLSKLLMADQDAPLDLTIKKTPAEPSEQDGVLDLSIKKNRYSGNLPVRSPCLSPATSTVKGESPDLRVAKAKDLQSTSTLEQFMAKLCPHHQRQIVDAIGFLQTEVKALASSNAQQASNSTSEKQGSACSTAKSTAVTPEKSCHELRFPSESTPKSEVQDISHSVLGSCATKKVPENGMLKTPVTAGSTLDLRSLGSGSNHALVTPTANPVDTENTRHSDHAPLRMRILTSNVPDGKKLSCVLSASHSDTLEDRQGNTNSSNRTETHSARLSSSMKRHSQASHTHQARQRETLGHAKDTPAKLFSVHMTIPSDSPRTARKTLRASSDHRTRDSACRGMVDPDLGHCDIVFIDKPITECFKEQHRSVLPRRNARKSTRGHMYSDEIWELKTVRTLAGRGNCPNPMPELITLVTPKQILSKPEGVPPVDMPFAGACRETMNQQMSTEESDESVIPGTGDVVELADGEVDVIVETSQTDQCQSKGQSAPPSSTRSPTENKETDISTDREHNTTADSGMAMGNEEGVSQALCEAEKDNESEPQEDIAESTEEIVAETSAEPLENITIEEAETEVSFDKLNNSEPTVQQNSTQSPINQVEEKTEGNEREERRDEQPQELQSETQSHYDNFKVTEKSNIIGSAEEPIVKELDFETSEAVDTENDDVSSKTLDALLKELPPWRRKRGTVISLPKRLKQAEAVIVGYVNGRPISASDRSLRRRSSNSATSPNKTPVKSSENVPNKTSFDSTVENKHLEKHLPETHIPVNSSETTSGMEQATEPSPDISSSSSRDPSRTKQIHKHKRAQRDQDSLTVLSKQPIDSPQKRQLRSTSQKPTGTPVPPSTSNAVTFISSPKPTASHLQSTEQLPSLPLPSPIPVTSPSTIRSSPTAASEQSQQNTVPEAAMEFNTGKSQPVETTSEEIQKNEVESRLPAKQKLRSAKVVADNSKNEKQQLSDEISVPSENQSPVKTEMQTPIMPLRNKRVLRKDAEASDAFLQKPIVASLEGRSASGDGCNSSTSDKPTRMPLRSESSKTEMSPPSATQSPPVDNKKLALRSQRLATPSTSTITVVGRQSVDVASPIRIMPERITKVQVRPPPVSVASVLPHSSPIPAIMPRPEPPKQTTNKFFEILTGEENQQLITNLNIKYDKMQKGWVQMDKEGQPATKYKNKADRQAAIWKSKRRARKPKSSEHQRYSPVQMLFMKGFNLTNICRWFLESTETKSLVIVKKVNTRLPSETQLCFHSSSSASGTSQGVFPSLQAERLKKHLKKFAIASPVKSNPKSQKLIAKALEQEANAVKGKERRELPSTTQTLTKSHSSAETRMQIGEPQKSSGKSKNPASARILRKYSNIRGKMQVQQTNVRLKKASKTLKTNKMKRLVTTKSATKSDMKSSLKGQKSPLRVSKQMKAAKMERRKTLAGKRTERHPVQERAVKAQGTSRAARDTIKKELPKRCSQRLGSPKISEHNPVDTTRSKTDNKKPSDAEKVEVEKTAVNKMHAAKIQAKASSQSTHAEFKVTENAAETPPQSTDVKVQGSPDQVLTRSQRKMEAAFPLSGSPSHATKRATKSMTTQNASPKSSKKADESPLSRRWALKSPVKRSQAALLPRSATKSATKRAQELLETPAKRTRTSLSK
ncbi:mucin-17 isoform X1 [Toxotes jaculatrix]|uniref:mucin-17 isoform X1 n=1 Tax=Toxotes jaculatrix TaxID=941984 RepID=UPI001B3AA5C4|nr:mucin-17 isoform X1 [Toxotes jaculatrix]